MVRQQVDRGAGADICPNRIRARRLATYAAVASLVVIGTWLGMMTAHADDALGARGPVDGCATWWTLRLVAVPDSVGVGGYQCGGCDRQTTSGDRQAASAKPLQPLQVVISAPGDRTKVYWRGSLSGGDASSVDAQQVVTLCVPPPYEVRLLTTAPFGYRLCPNSPATYLVAQDNFDSARNMRLGEGRGFQLGWFFWSCAK